MTTKALGDNVKVKLLLSKQANIVDDKGRIVRAEIVTVKGNDANKLFVRRNIITKGAVIEVVLGADHRLAKVTNRPGQTGEIDAIVLPVDAIKQYTKERVVKEHKTAQTGETKQNTSKEAEKTKN
jgi:small subunit ribosomal protein S8e